MPLTTTEEIKSKINIVDLVREYIEVKPAGSNHKALCPFHNEKTPSFMISPERQMYHCFGCGENGDIFSFVQKMEGIEFPEALRILAKKAGVEIRTQDPRLRNEKTKLHDILRFAGRFYSLHLQNLSEDHPVKKYLAKRKLSQEMIDLFQLGFAPDSWDAMTQALQKKNVRFQDAEAAGLVVRKDDGSGYYDRFRARLMFPIFDAHGSIVGFGGRVIPDLAAKATGKEPAKYINSPQSLVYNKSAVVFGLHLAKNAIRSKQQAVVVEGYMDCISAHRAGTENVVAVSGTAFTREQAQLLKRFTPNVALAFDMDEAGIQAASRSVGVLLNEGLTVRVIPLDGVKDPDDLIAKDPELWKSAIAKPKLFMDFAFDQAIKNKDFENVEDKKHVAKTLLPLIASIADGVEQSHYIQKLSDLLSVEESVLRQSLTKLKIQTSYAAKTESRFNRPKGNYLIELLSVVIKKPDFFSEVVESIPPEAIDDESAAVLYRVVRDQYNQEQQLRLAEVRQKLLALNNPEALTMLDIAELGASRLSEGIEATGKHLIASIMKGHLKRRLEIISRDIALAEKSDDKVKLQELATSFESITKDLNRFTSNM